MNCVKFRAGREGIIKQDLAVKFPAGKKWEVEEGVGRMHLYFQEPWKAL